VLDLKEQGPGCRCIPEPGPLLAGLFHSARGILRCSAGCFMQVCTETGTARHSAAPDDQGSDGAFGAAPRLRAGTGTLGPGTAGEQEPAAGAGASPKGSLAYDPAFAAPEVARIECAGNGYPPRLST
jgi:hypothetical protein